PMMLAAESVAEQFERRSGVALLDETTAEALVEPDVLPPQGQILDRAKLTEQAEDRSVLRCEPGENLVHQGGIHAAVLRRRIGDGPILRTQSRSAPRLRGGEPAEVRMEGP